MGMYQTEAPSGGKLGNLLPFKPKQTRPNPLKPVQLGQLLHQSDKLWSQPLPTQPYIEDQEEQQCLRHTINAMWCKTYSTLSKLNQIAANLELHQCEHNPAVPHMRHHAAGGCWLVLVMKIALSHLRF